MRKICIDFGIMTMVNVSVIHRYFVDEYNFELCKNGIYISTLDMKTYKLEKVKSVENLYRVERR